MTEWYIAVFAILGICTTVFFAVLGAGYLIDRQRRWSVKRWRKRYIEMEAEKLV